jgi:hypothetical protein
VARPVANRAARNQLRSYRRPILNTKNTCPTVENRAPANRTSPDDFLRSTGQKFTGSLAPEATASTQADGSAVAPLSLATTNHPLPTSSLIRLHHRQSRSINWLWQGRIPLEKVTLLIGDSDTGKSFVALDLAARVTRGEGVPPEPGLGRPGSVLLLSADDDLDDTILPRLTAAGADLERISLLPSLIHGEDGEQNRLLSLAKDVARLREALDELPDCRLFVIDPISAYLRGIDANSNVDVRQVLLELANIAREHHTALLLVSHHRKESAASVLHRAIGSLAFTSVARAVLTLAEDPVESGRRLLLPVKMTLQPGGEGRAFRIETTNSSYPSPAKPPATSDDFTAGEGPGVRAQELCPVSDRDTPDRCGQSPDRAPHPSRRLRRRLPTTDSLDSPPSSLVSTGRIIWEDETIPMTGDELQHLARSGLASVDARREAAEWIKDELADGKIRSTEIERRAKANGIPHNVLWDAKKLAGVKIKPDPKDHRWYWQIPDPLDWDGGLTEMLRRIRTSNETADDD